MKKQFTILSLILAAFWMFPTINYAGVTNEVAKVLFADDEDVNAAVYPNPADHQIFVNLDIVDPAFIQGAKANFEIRSILGNVMPLETEQVDADTYRININNYPAGYYLLIVRCVDCENTSATTKNVFKFLKR